MKVFFSLLAATYRRWDSDKAPRMGAALSFYTVFSFAPLVILMMTLISLTIEKEAARAEIVSQFQALVGNDGAAMAETVLAKATMVQTSLWGTLLSFAVLLIGASGVFGELQDSFNQIWNVSTKRNPAFVLVQERIFSFAMILIMTCIMFLSFLLSATASLIGQYLHGRSRSLDMAWEMGNSAISLLVITLLFALIFRGVPDVRIAWKDVWFGAMIAAVLFVLGKFVLGYYLGRSSISSSYGAASSLVIFLIWVYYSAQILFFGAEFTRVYALRYGSHRKDGPAEQKTSKHT